MNRKSVPQSFIFILLAIGLPYFSMGQEMENRTTPPGKGILKITLVKAVMSEGIKDNQPFNETVVFSKTIREVFCFTIFDPVPESSFIYHKWFFRDVLNRTTKLSVNPPRWSTYSSMDVRDSDKGPWHVEITDSQGNILKILRFSIVE
jgi:hypothetical protein